MAPDIGCLATFLQGRERRIVVYTSNLPARDNGNFFLTYYGDYRGDPKIFGQKMPGMNEHRSTFQLLVDSSPGIERHLHLVEALKAEGYELVTFKYLTRNEVSHDCIAA